MPTRTRAFHKKKVSAWVKHHLAGAHAVSTDMVKRSDKLRHWGIVHEGHLAELAGSFNHAMRIDPEMAGSVVAPPQLVKAVGEDAAGKTVGNLIDFMADATSRPTAKEIEGILLRRLGGHGGVNDRTSSLRNVHPSQNEANLINVDCRSTDAASAYEQCLTEVRTPTVATVASCMSRKLGSA